MVGLGFVEKIRKRIIVDLMGDELLTISVDDITNSQINKRQEHLCFYCGNRLGKGSTRDHFFPKSKGNKLKGNTVMSCSICNQSKGDRLPTRNEIKRYLKLYNGIIYKKGDKDVRDIQR